MRTHFFKPVYTAIKISPYFLFKALCGFSILNDMKLDDSPSLGDRNFIRFLFACRFILPSIKTMQMNYGDYKHALQLFDKYGYRRKWADFFMESTCGRQQLKTVCKERQSMNEYHQHYKDKKVRWHQIDGNPSLSRAFKFDFFLVSGLTQWSHQLVGMESEKTPDKTQRKGP